MRWVFRGSGKVRAPRIVLPKSMGVYRVSMQPLDFSCLRKVLEAILGSVVKQSLSLA